MEDKKMEKLVEYIAGGEAEGMTPEDIAKKHGVDVKIVNEQLKMGIKVEHEHSPDDKIAAEIAKDHLAESPFYYTYLERMEEEMMENLKEDIKRGEAENEEEEEDSLMDAKKKEEMKKKKEDPEEEEEEEDPEEQKKKSEEEKKKAEEMKKKESKKTKKDSTEIKQETLQRLFG